MTEVLLSLLFGETPYVRKVTGKTVRHCHVMSSEDMAESALVGDVEFVVARYHQNIDVCREVQK